MIRNNQTSAKKIVAWQINEFCEGTSVIVFDHHGLAARRRGANQINEEFDDVECCSAPEFDQYADVGKVPRDVLLSHGWWFECDQCYLTVNEDDCCPVSLYHCSWKCYFNGLLAKLKGIFK